MCSVKTIMLAVVLLSAEVADEDKEVLFRAPLYNVLEFCVYWSGDDPEVVRAWDSYKSLCQEVLAGTKSAEQAEKEFRSDRLNIFAPLVDEIQACPSVWGELRWCAYGVSKRTPISRSASLYWVLWFCVAAVGGSLMLILCSVAWLLDRFTLAISLPESLYSLAGTFFVIHFVVFIILLAGGIVPLLNAFAVIAAILASLAGIVLGIVKVLK